MAKTVALGSLLKVKIGGTYTTVKGLTVVPAPSPTRPEIDVTSLDSTGAEFLGGIPDNGELAVSGFADFDDEGQLLLLGDAHAPSSVTRDFLVDFVPQQVQFAFQGYVSSFVPTAGGPNEAITVDIGIRVTGAVDIYGVS